MQKNVLNRTQAKQMGFSDEEINSYAQKNNLSIIDSTPTPEPTGIGATPKEAMEKSGHWSDWLPAVGAIAGSFVPGVGTIVGGAAGAGLGAIAKQFVDEKEGFDGVDVAKEAGLGLIGGGVGKIAGKVGGKVLSKVGQSMTGAGDDLALKTIRPNKTQLNNYLKQHGEDMRDVIKRNNLVGKSANQIEDEAIRPLQESFNSVVESTKLRVDPTDLDNKFYQKVTKLLASPSTEDHKLAEKILLEYDSIISSVGNKPITGQALNKFRQTFDGKVKSWLADPIESGKNRVVGSTLREVLQESADKAGLTAGDQTFKQAGLELSKLYSIRDLAGLQANLGRGNLPVGLMDLLGLGSGGLVGSVGMGLAGGPAGAALGLGATKLLNNPKAIAAYSKMLTAAGGKLDDVAIPQSVSQTVGQMGVRAPLKLSGQIPNSENDNEPQDSENNLNHIPGTLPQDMGASQGLGATPQDAMIGGDGLGERPSYVTGHSPDELGRAYTKALMAGDTASSKQLKTMYDFELEHQENIGGGSQSFTPGQLKELSDIQTSIDLMNSLEPLLEEKSYLFGPIKGQMSKNPYATESKAVESQFRAAAQLVGKAMEGGVLRKEDEEKYRRMLPQVTDTPAVSKAKIDNVRRMVQMQLQTKQMMYTNFDTKGIDYSAGLGPEPPQLVY